MYVATGSNYADALTGGPRAAQAGAPILLVLEERVPAVTAAELRRLRPGRVVVLGGSAAVGERVLAELRGLTGVAVERVWGRDRYATAAAISASGFAAGIDTVYIASGVNYPDALTGGAIAAREASPVLLATPNALPQATAGELARLRPRRIVVLGGAAAIAGSVVAALQPFAELVERRAGPDRYGTAVKVVTAAFRAMPPATVYIATGSNYPDALAGVPAAGGAPVLLTQRDCLPPATASALARLRPARLVLLGGPAAVGAGPGRLVHCESRVPLPTFAVDPALRPAQAALPALGGAPRPVARVVDESGRGADFVSDELSLTTDVPGELDAFLTRWGGTVLSRTDPAEAGIDFPTTYVVRIDPARGDPARLSAALRALDPASRGQHRVSSGAGLGLLAAAAEAAAGGAFIGLSLVKESADIPRRTTTEAPATSSTAPGYTPNAFAWPHMKAQAGKRIGVGEAWFMLHRTGKLGNRIRMAVLDRGFVTTNPDYPPLHRDSHLGPPNRSRCGGQPCPWHGTHVTLSAAALPDNNFGVAGPAGPVAEVRTIQHGPSLIDDPVALTRAKLSGARIINMSYSAMLPAALSFALLPFDHWTAALRATGVLLFASAGNEGLDVDEEDCFIVCWETHWISPCENHGVICVGGLDGGDSLSRHRLSNYGYESCGSAACNVDIF